MTPLGTIYSTIYGIVKVFEEATTSLQGETYETSNLTIPYVCGVLNVLEKWESEEVAQANPLITFGLQEARKKLLHPVHPNDIDPLKDIYLATVLDPHMKLGVLPDLGLANSTISAIEDYYCFEVFHRYKRELAAEENGNSKTRRDNDPGRQSVGVAGRMSDLFYKKHDTAGDDDESDIWQYLAQPRSPRSISVRGFYENQKYSYPTMYRVAKNYLSMRTMSAASESLFSRAKNIVTDNRNKLDATTIQILAILKARCLLRDELSTTADSFQAVQVNRDANQDDSVADDTTAADDTPAADDTTAADDTPAADDATLAGDASSVQSSAASGDEECVLVSSDDE